MNSVKKGIAVIAALLLMSMTNDLKPEIIDENALFGDCTDEAFGAMDDMLAWGYSASQASCMGNAVYAVCEGWFVPIEQAMECFN